MDEELTIDEKLAKLDVLRKGNVGLLQALARDGVPNIDLGGARLEILIEFLLPYEAGTNERRLDFELVWEIKANEALQNVAREVARAKLTQGVSMAPQPTANGHGSGLRGV